MAIALAVLSWGRFFMSKIPWQVWAGLAVLVAVLYYGHVREKRGRTECQAQVQLEKDAELRRQESIAKQVIEEAKHEEAEAKQSASEMKERLDAALKDVAKLEEANKICLPEHITNQYRGVRNNRHPGSSSSKSTSTPPKR